MSRESLEQRLDREMAVANQYDGAERAERARDAQQHYWNAREARETRNMEAIGAAMQRSADRRWEEGE